MAATSIERSRRRPVAVDHIPGTVYLIHLDKPYKHAKHYLGWTANLDARLADHERGAGARLLQVARDAGIGWRLARTWPGDRHRERQLKRQGGRAACAPLCKHPKPCPQEAVMDTATPPADAEHNEADGTFRAELPGDLTSARHARSAVRRALAAWGMDDPSGDAVLLASEIVSNAAEHGGGSRISLALSRTREPGGRAGITCEVTDASPALPQSRQAGPGAERARGMAIVAALATASGVRTEPAGKTTWFTLAVGERIQQNRPPGRARGRGRILTTPNEGAHHDRTQDVRRGRG